MLLPSVVLVMSLYSQVTSAKTKEESFPETVIDPVHAEVRMAGLWLAAHKYFEVDKRKGSDLAWKYDERVYHKHFPLPRLKRLHPRAKEACDKGVMDCVRDVAGLARDSYSLSDLHPDTMPDIPMSYPFDTQLELFQYRTTATYYMCWFTMQRCEILMNYMTGKPCLFELEKVKEKAWADVEVLDIRTDTVMSPFQCAEIQFCPDPCYGRKTEGRVKNLMKDPGNPCRHLKDKTCDGLPSKNVDFESLQRNRFNITCNCKDEKPGYVWNSRYELCVDIDECEDEKIKCRYGKTCQNVPGHYKCTCRRGHRFDSDKQKCVEQVPLPAHQFARTGKVKAKRQKTALMRMMSESWASARKERKETVIPTGPVSGCSKPSFIKPLSKPQLTLF